MTERCLLEIDITTLQKNNQIRVQQRTRDLRQKIRLAIDRANYQNHNSVINPIPFNISDIYTVRK